MKRKLNNNGINYFKKNHDFVLISPFKMYFPYKIINIRKSIPYKRFTGWMIGGMH
jgi:hypothetical protein